jgi:glycosyltransferase involved in cell wall biosynthesis
MHCSTHGSIRARHCGVFGSAYGATFDGAQGATFDNAHGATPACGSRLGLPTMPLPRAAAAILYDPEGYETRGERLMGRHAAGEAFLTAMVRYSGMDPLVALVQGRAHAEAFARQVAALSGGRVQIEAITADVLPLLARVGCLMLPGPELGSLAWRRRRQDPRAYSLVGITHTTASERAMDAIAGLLTAPVQPWDALICTSRAVAAMARRLLEQEAAYLRARLGAARFDLPELPVIPLGVDCDAFAPDARWRAEWRARLGIGEGDAAVLMLGRLSFHAKAHPLPMFMALGRAAEAVPGRRVHLILAGWFANEGQREVFVRGAAALCPNVTLHLQDGRHPDVRRQLWSAADAFTLLSDNIQETFGLAPLEGMAAGLPVVVSDWDGFRDTVEHGVHGFRVPTLMAGPQEDLADRHAAGLDSYDSYVAGAAMFSAVDVPATTEAYRALIADPALARRMGEAGRQRARMEFDWPVVIARYRELWEELAARRAAAPVVAARAAGEDAVPRRPDPALAFSGYPSRHLSPEIFCQLAPGADAMRLRALLSLPGTVPRADLLPPESALAGVLARLAAGPARVEDLVAGLNAAQALRLRRALAWMAKFDLLRVS